VKRVPRKPSRFEPIALFDAISREKGLSFGDAAGHQVFMETVAAAIESCREQPLLLQGGHAQKMFGYVVASLGNCSLIKEEDAGEVFADQDVRVPDYRLALKDGSHLLVEVKSLYQKDLRAPINRASLALTDRYATQLRNYAELLGVEVKLAVYWIRWGLWTLVNLDRFRQVGTNHVLSLLDAIESDEMFRLGDYRVGVETPLVLRFLTDPGKPRTIDSDGNCFVTIGAVEVLSGSTLIEDPLERRFAYYLMLFGDWPIVDRPVSVEDGALLYWDLVVSPEDPAPEQGFQLLGPMSSILSREYNALTRSAEGIQRQSPDREPGSLGVRLPDDFQGKQLKVWRLKCHPKWWEFEPSGDGSPL
jgi:hypothetical protein